MPAATAPTTASVAPATSAWETLVEAVLAHDGRVPELIGGILARHPDDSRAHAVKGLMLVLLARAELVGEARRCLAVADRLATSGDGAGGYRAVLRSWLAGEPLVAARHLETQLASDPGDALAFKMAHQTRFMAGDVAGMLASASRHGQAHAGQPHEGYVLGCLAFALEESGDIRRAEATGRKAIALAPRDAWGRHAVAHCLEMTGRAEEGAAWLAATTDTWRHCTSFAFHISWHLALFLLDQGRIGEVLDLYDTGIRATRADDYRDLANGASMLARLEFEGVDVGDRWEELAELSARRVQDRRLVFADLHYATALLGAGATADAEALAASMLADASRGATHDARVAAAAGLAAMEGLLAFHAGRYGEAARHLLRARPQMPRIGGSIAQRDLFEQMLVESLIRSGDLAGAEAMLRERLVARGGRNTFATRRLARIAGSTRREARTGALALSMVAAAASH